MLFVLLLKRRTGVAYGVPLTLTCLLQETSLVAIVQCCLHAEANAQANFDVFQEAGALQTGMLLISVLAAPLSCIG